MIMDKVHILPTGTTPEVHLSPEGIIKIKGRAIDENIKKIPKEIMNWIDAYLLNPAELTEVIIELEYLNSFNTIILISILKKLSEIILHGGKLVIHWYYEKDDEDMFERGNEISSTINIPFEFIPTNTFA